MSAPSSPPTPVVVQEDAIRALVTEADALASAKVAFTAMATEGAVQQPPPMGYDLPDEVEVHVKGAALAGSKAMAVKMATGGYKNRERGLGPAGAGLVVVLDVYTGYPVAVLLENAWLTDMRTAAAGALASTLLISPSAPADGCTLTILGAGVQAKMHARSVTSAMPGRFAKIVVWTRDAAKAAAAAEEIQAELAGSGIVVSSEATVAAAVAGAVLVVTVTPAREPLLEAEWLHPSATVVAVGSDGGGKRELGDSVLAAAVLSVVDNREQCGSLGELQFAPAEQLAASVPLGEILVGTHPGRAGGEGIVIADLTGCGAQDAAMGAEVWAKLQKQASL